MNAETPPESVNESLEPEALEDSPPKPSKPSKPAKSGGRWKWILLLVVMALLAGGMYFGQQLVAELTRNRTLLKQSLERADGDVQALREQLLTLQKQLNDTIQPRLEKLQNQQLGMRETLTALHQRQNAARDGAWNVAEVIYLLQVAQQRLLLSQDTASALAALQAADKRLRQAGDPRFLPIRDLLAKDMNRLRAVEQPDIAGMALRLADYADQAPGLPLLQGAQGSEEVAAAESSTAQPTAWTDLPGAVWKELRELIVIRRNQGGEAGLLTPEQRELLTWNLRLKLESARFALLRRDAPQFGKEAEILLRWLDRYYDGNAKPVRMLREDLQAMRAAPLRPELPGLARTVSALRDLATDGDQP